MEDDTLYAGRIKIKYFHPPRSEGEEDYIDPETHELLLQNREGEWNRYILQHGILDELARVPKDQLRLLERKLNTISSGQIPFFLIEEGISVEDIGLAIRTAYATEEKAREEGITKIRAELSHW